MVIEYGAALTTPFLRVDAWPFVDNVSKTNKFAKSPLSSTVLTLASTLIKRYNFSSL